jgi:enoyl-CoA hydratase/carnithine racemase
VNPDDPFPRTDSLFIANVLFNLTQLPQATIAVVEGPARGLGNEFLFSCDMRFASQNALFGNFEASVGLSPGAGGTFYMPLLIGRGRAYEYLFSGKDIDSSTAEQFGWINKAFDTSAELRSYVDDLASRIALFPLDGLASIKSSVNLISRPTQEDLIFVSSEFDRLAALPNTQELLGKLLVLTKNETDVTVELNISEEVFRLY